MNPGNDVRAVRAEVSVLPMRFTNNVAAMRDFLALLGLSTRVSKDEGWITMAGEAGMVALHSLESTPGTRSGKTDLWFETTDLEALSARFVAAGFDQLDVYDEAFGRELAVRGAEGREMGFDQPSDDLYGYRLDEPEPAHGIASMPVLAEDPAGPFARMLMPAGFSRLDEGDDAQWRVWSNGAGGLVALCTPPGGSGPVEEPESVRLGFRTLEPLHGLALRLTNAGYSDATVADATDAPDLGELTVTDPDGQRVLVQPLSTT